MQPLPFSIFHLFTWGMSRREAMKSSSSSSSSSSMNFPLSANCSNLFSDINKILRTKITDIWMFNTYFLCEDASWYGTTRRISAAARSASHLLFAELWNILDIMLWIIHPWKEQWTWQLGPWRSAVADKIDCNFV